MKAEIFSQITTHGRGERQGACKAENHQAQGLSLFDITVHLKDDATVTKYWHYSSDK